MLSNRKLPHLKSLLHPVGGSTLGSPSYEPGLDTIHQQDDDSFFELFKDSSSEGESNEVQESFPDSSFINSHKLQEEQQKVRKKAMDDMSKIVSYFLQQIRLMYLKNKPQQDEHHSDSICEEIKIDKKTKKLDELFDVIEEDSFAVIDPLQKDDVAKEDDRKFSEKEREEKKKDKVNTEEIEDQIFKFGAVLLVLFEKALLTTQKKYINYLKDLDEQISVLRRKQQCAKCQDTIIQTKCDVIKSLITAQHVMEGKVARVDNDAKVTTVQKSGQKRKLKKNSEAEPAAFDVSLIESSPSDGVVKEVETLTFSKKVRTRKSSSEFLKKEEVAKRAKVVSKTAIQTNTKVVTPSIDGVTLDNESPLPEWLRKATRKAVKTVTRHSTSFYGPNGFKFRSRPSFARYLAKTSSNLKQFIQKIEKSSEENKELKEEIEKLKSLLESQKEEFMKIKEKSVEENKEFMEEIKKLKSLLKSQKDDLPDCTSENCSSTIDTSVGNDLETKQKFCIVSPTSMTKKSPIKTNVTKNKKNKFSTVDHNTRKNKENSKQGGIRPKSGTLNILVAKQRTPQKRKLEVRESVSLQEPPSSNVALIENNSSDDLLKDAEDSKVSTQLLKSNKKRKVATKTKDVLRKTANVETMTSSIDDGNLTAEKLPPGWLKKIKIRRNGVTKEQIGVYFCSPDGLRFYSKTELAAYLVKTKSNFRIENFNFASMQEVIPNSSIQEKMPNSSLLKTEIETQSNDQEVIQKKEKPSEENKELKEGIEKLKSFLKSQKEDLDFELPEEMKMPFKNKKNGSPFSVNHTFDERRNFLLREQPKMFLVKKMYPWLFSFDEIKKELDRLYYLKSSKFLVNVTKYSSRILETSKDPFKKSVLQVADAAETPKQRKHILETGSLLLLPNALKEGYSFLRMNTKKLEKSIYPYIRAPSSCKKIIDLLTHCGIYQVVVDECVICKPNNLSEALLALLASIFIFNIEYDPACYATYVLIETLFLEINVTQAIPDQTIKVFKMLKHGTTA